MKKTEESKADEDKFTYEQLIEGLKDKKYKKVVFMTGAGISVSAGIPDFRSPGTGLYSNLQQYDLPYPEAIFEMDYFNKKPEAFYKLAESFLSLDKFDATPTHHFCKMLYDKKIVSHYLTQNIDNLESKAGFTPEEVNQAHGANFGAECAKCGVDKDQNKLTECISKGTVMYCDKECDVDVKDKETGKVMTKIKGECRGPIKPKITFFGQSLPDKFMEVLDTIQNQCDLLIVIGTALAVQPFCSIVNIISKKTPKVLINMTNTENYDFDNKEDHPERLLIKGKCDETIRKISKDCGWDVELDERIEKYKQSKDLTQQMDNLNIEENKKEDSSQIEEKKIDEPEEGPLMGFFAVTPIAECPHCTPENILPIEEFKDITVSTPCRDCGHTKENWVCLKTKVVLCSRYVKGHMVKHNEEHKHPIALSFADFSFWCYECDSYVTSKYLNHVNHFYPQKFGSERVGPLQEYAIVKNSKAEKK